MPQRQTDEKKGERLAVLHTLREEDIPGIVDKLSELGLPNLFIPRPNQFVKVKELPLLGTGKLDLRGIKKIALEAFGAGPEAASKDEESDKAEVKDEETGKAKDNPSLPSEGD